MPAQLLVLAAAGSGTVGAMRQRKAAPPKLVQPPMRLANRMASLLGAIAPAYPLGHRAPAVQRPNGHGTDTSVVSKASPAASPSRRALSEATEQAWGLQLGVAEKALAELHQRRPRTALGTQLSVGKAASLQAQQQAGACKRGLAPVANPLSPAAYSPSAGMVAPLAKPSTATAAASGAEPSSLGGPSGRLLQRGMRHRPGAPSLAGRPPTPLPMSLEPAAGGMGASRAGPRPQQQQPSTNPTGLPQAMAASASPALDPAADAELLQLQSQLAALPAMLAAAAPAGLRRELLELLRRQRSYVGVRQQVGT